MNREKKNLIITDNKLDIKTRRRGQILEAAILNAVWNELNDIGYIHLTFDNVALRAKTNKTTIYRRWNNKAKLVVAALQKHMPKPFDNIPNNGNLRDDVLTLLERVAKVSQIIGSETMHGLMLEYFEDKLITSLPQILSRSNEGISLSVMKKILENAQRRGEVDIKKITQRIILLPFDLVRYEILTKQEPISYETIVEIVDDIFIPLVRK